MNDALEGATVPAIMILLVLREFLSYLRGRNGNAAKAIAEEAAMRVADRAANSEKIAQQVLDQMLNPQGMFSTFWLNKFREISDSHERIEDKLDRLTKQE